MLLLLFFILVATNFSSNKVDGLTAEEILNGLLGTAMRFRYLVAVVYKVNNVTDVNPCAGGLLSSRYIATAAHCFFNKTTGQYINKQFFIVISTINVFHPIHSTRYILVDLVITPTYYQPTQPDTYRSRGDLAIVKLSRNLGYINDQHPTLKTLNIPGRHFKYLGKKFYISAYGWHRFLVPLNEPGLSRGITDGKLRYLTANVLTDDECRHAVRDNIAPGNMCARILLKIQNLAMGICEGDSGAPLVKQHHLKGIAVNGFANCDERQFPGIYINTSYYRDFIRDAISRTITEEMNVFQLNKYGEEYVFERYRQRRTR